MAAQQKVKIVNPKTKQESVIVSESLPVWEGLGWVVAKDDVPVAIPQPVVVIPAPAAAVDEAAEEEATIAQFTVKAP